MPDSDDSASRDAPRIFFSYASEDRYWVDAFKDPTWFGAVGNVMILDYSAEQVGYGQLKDALDQQICRSAVIVAFVSTAYCKKQWTVAEWEQSLSEVQRRRLVFVPIMLDADAKSWWQKLRIDGKLSELSRDYQYFDFTDGSGSRIEFSPKDTRAPKIITQLAQQIREDLEKTWTSPPTAPSASPRGPTPSLADAGIKDSGAPVLGEDDGADVVVLGHPTAALPPEIGDHIHKLRTAAEALDIRTQAWGDGWRKNADARGKLGGAFDPIFVQPVSVGEASDRILDPGAIGKYLEAVVRHARVVLWLPQAYYDPDFDAAAKSAAGSKEFPIPRTDASDQLAQWLCSFKKKDQPADETKIQVQTMALSDETTPQQAIVSQRIIQQLQDEISSIADQLVDNPRPKPPPWPFWDSQFKDQIRILPGNRTIVAIHDLDVRPGNERAIEKQLQIKFETIQKAIDEEQETRTKAGKPQLNTFLTALLVNNANALPFGNYPDDGRYGRWRLLGFAPPGAPGEAAPLKPDPASLAVFKTNLLAWAHSQ